jgi:elongation factor P--beta-lysine ligase
MKLNLRRYHYKIYFPENTGEMLLEFVKQLPDKIDVTYHAAEELFEDKRGIIPLPSKIELLHNDNQLVEVYERLDKNNKPINQIQKIVIRISNLSEKYDYAYVLAREGYVVSAWANAKTDYHRILENFHLYYCPAELQAGKKKVLEEQAKKYVKVPG